MRIVTFGVGYVGLVTGTGLAELGHDVLCVDVDEARVRELHAGVLPLYEPGLGDLVRRNTRSERLRFSTRIDPPFDRADVYFIAVGTPLGEGGLVDTRGVFDAALRVADVAERSALVAIKSTVPVGTCDAVEACLAKLRSKSDVAFEVVHNPEFMKEGTALADFFRPERIVLGARSERAVSVLRALYAPLQLSGERVVVTDPRSSELIKYASNAMLAMRVSFMNELSRLCHATGANIHAVRLGVGSDSRIGKRFLYAGPGYGGSCFPKDVVGLAAMGRAHGVPMRLAEATALANAEQGAFVAELVKKSLAPIAGKRVAFWGLAFKPETDDVREAPSIKLAESLLGEGAVLVGHDPEAGPAFSLAMGGRVAVVDRDYDALEGADALVLLTEWLSYRAPNFVEIRRRMRGPRPVVIDLRNVWRPLDAQKAGLRYVGVGVAVPQGDDEDEVR
jgi:UDPglucose 6-dehydrogenase